MSGGMKLKINNRPAQHKIVASKVLVNCFLRDRLGVRPLESLMTSTSYLFILF